mmetsp:Transcript_116287/g.182952  ORF Transcript_116287/g.182952 Transcript_116287/m.182952 type:complete len:99 (-) Transcript_116287:212-508(-)
MFTMTAERSTVMVGECTCQNVPLRMRLQVHQTNCTRLNMSVIMMATCNPWKKSTTPVPEPPFITLAPTCSRAATTIGQHQAPIMAGNAKSRVPIEPKN